MVEVPMQPWGDQAPGVLALPSGLRVRGRALRRPVPPGDQPTYGVYLLGAEPAPVPWECRWVRWPDFRLPTDRRDAAAALREAYRRLGSDRVEIACEGGRGRTGTALACLVALDTGRAAGAVAFVREHHDAHAVETPWQRGYVHRFLGADQVMGRLGEAG